MRKLVITQNITLDGSIEMLDDWFDPQRQDDDLLAESHRQDARADALLVGRRTFEDFRGYWPKQVDDATGISAYLDQVAKYVVSSTLSDPQWANTTVLTGDLVERVHELKSQGSEDAKDIVLTGSISLAHTLIAAGVVDEYRLFVYPCVQGRGRRLFPDGTAIRALTLVEPRRHSNRASCSFDTSHGDRDLRYADRRRLTAGEKTTQRLSRRGLPRDGPGIQRTC